MSERKKFGLSAALVTPFDEKGAIDLKRLIRHANDVLARGCDSITLFGTTGEGFSIALRERAAMLGAAIAGGIGADRIYAGVFATTLEDGLDQANLALDMGARGLLLAPPYFFKQPDDDGLYRWYSQLIERLGPKARGIILYHIPGQTAVPLSLDLIRRLQQAFPSVIVAIKDSSGDWRTAQAFLEAHGDLAILVGDERLLARAVELGAEGSICGLANLAPELLRPVIHEGKDDRRVSELVELIVSYPVLPAVKALVGHLTGDSGYAVMRPPLTQLESVKAARLAAAYDAILAGKVKRKSA